MLDNLIVTVTDTVAILDVEISKKKWGHALPAGLRGVSLRNLRKVKSQQDRKSHVQTIKR